MIVSALYEHDYVDTKDWPAQSLIQSYTYVLLCTLKLKCSSYNVRSEHGCFAKETMLWNNVFSTNAELQEQVKRWRMFLGNP